MLLGVVAPEDARRVLDLDAVAVQLDSLARRRRSANRATEVAPVVVRLRDGGRVTLRPVVASDWHALADGDGRVSEESLRMRFFTEPPRSERRLRRLTDPDHRAEFAWAAVVDDELVGIGRYALQAEDRSAAEFALLVADAHQGRGIGRLLVEAIVVTASVHGADVLVAIAREENHAVRHMLRRFGAQFVAGPEDGVVVARWPIDVALTEIGDDERHAALARVARVVLAPVRTA
jgi:RimJ/RimL family protein N-acetyltransferase